MLQIMLEMKIVMSGILWISFQFLISPGKLDLNAEKWMGKLILGMQVRFDAFCKDIGCACLCDMN